MSVPAELNVAYTMQSRAGILLANSKVINYAYSLHIYDCTIGGFNLYLVCTCLKKLLVKIGYNLRKSFRLILKEKNNAFFLVKTNDLNTEFFNLFVRMREVSSRLYEN